jgi:hypothetical protein
MFPSLENPKNAGRRRAAVTGVPVFRSKLSLLTVLFLFLLPVGVAFATTQYNYWTQNAGSWAGHPSGYLVPRSYNRMWHQCSNYQSNWGSVEYYANGNGTPISGTADQDNYLNCRNPVQTGSYSGNVESWCGGNGPVTNVTCQTTRP